MSKLQIVLLALFILGLVGAVNSITNQSTLEKEKGFLNGVLSLIGLTYKPEPEPVREFDFVPGKVTSEISKLTPESLKATPSAKPGQITPPTTATPNRPFSSPSPSPLNQYNFTFTNEIPVPPITPNGQTLGINTQNTSPTPSPSTGSSQKQKPPIPPVGPNQTQSQGKSTDIIDQILKFFSLN